VAAIRDVAGDEASHMQAYSAAQLQELTHPSINAYESGWVAAQQFFGTGLFPLGYLVYESRTLPFLPLWTPPGR
jgi:hypothetical protein